jgi:hypothetical protein
MSSLLPFIDPVPSCLATASLATWQRTCLMAACHHLVIVDEQQRPMGVVALARLLLLMAGEDRPPPFRQPPGPSNPMTEQNTGLAPEVAALIDVAPVLSVDTSPQAAAQTIAGMADRPWLVIDGQHRYVGLLNGIRLLDSLRQAPPLPSDPPATGMGSTTLLTYLGHELKTPLTSLLGLSSLLHTERIGSLSDRQSRYAALIQQHARRLTALVNAVLDLGRLEDDSLQLIPQIVEVAPLCQEAYRQAQLLVGHPETPAIDSAVLPNRVLVADTLRLGQMLTYLLQLTLKANPTETFPLKVLQWGPWVVFHAIGLGQTVTALPPPPTQGVLPPLTTPEGMAVGGWLELLLTRQLAQLHGGDLVMAVTATDTLDPMLILPGGTTPSHEPADSQLVVTTADAPFAIAIAQQLRPLNYRLLVTPPGADTLAVVARLQPAAVLVPANDQAIATLNALKADASTQACLAIALQSDPSTTPALCPPADRIVPWPSAELANVLTTQPAPLLPPPGRMTILYLKSLEENGAEGSDPDLSGLFHDCGCRVLEVDDLDQADLVSRVWQPDIVVLDPALQHSDTYLRRVSSLPHLSQLAVVTLTPEATQLAQQFPNLMVFPCLAGACAWREPEHQAQVSTWLIQVLQGVAAQKR